MNTTDTDLEAMVTTFKAANITATVDDGQLMLKTGGPSRELQALVFDAQQYNDLGLSLDSKNHKTLLAQTTYRVDRDFVYVFARSRYCIQSQELASGALLYAQGGQDVVPFDPAEVELIHGQLLPDVQDVPVDDWEALVNAVAEAGAPKPVAVVEPLATVEKKAKEEPKAVEVPAGVPNQPWATKTPPILGVTWYGKLRKAVGSTTLVMVAMVQIAEYAKEKAVKKGIWNGVYSCYASQDDLAKKLKISVSTVSRAWKKLIKAGLLQVTVKGGTERNGERQVSEFIIHGLGFPGSKKSKA